MIRRLFALVILFGLVAGGLYYWKARPAPPPEIQAVRERVRDAALTGAVKTALALNRSLESASLSVSTEDAVVTLRGGVPSDEARRMAVEIAQNVPQVRQVVDHIEVRPLPTASGPPGRSLGEVVDDEAIEARLRLALSLNRQVRDKAIQVKVFRREVQLSGTLETEAQRRVALEIARETPGVMAVRDGIRTADDPSKQ